MRIASLKYTLIAVAGLALVACGDDNDDNTNTNTNNNNNTNTSTTTLPEQVICNDSNVCELTGEITESFTMTKDKQWLLKGGVYIGNDTDETVLTIEPGTTVYGETSSKAFLCIRRGSKLMAEGTKDEPIVLTSSKEAGSRARGDWGGLVLNGKAPINGCDSAPCEAEGEGATGKYGGTDADDNSGTLKYIRVEFAGHPITPDNELNGIAFQGVGAGTTLEYIQVHMAADDGIEFFGGTAQFKYILATGISDDNLDWTDGWQGKGQFFVAQQYSDKGDNGIEADNNGDNNGAEPRSFPVLSNLTLIGSPESSKSDFGILLREGTAANIHSSLVVGWNDACLDIDHKETYANAYDGSDLTGELVIEASHLACEKTFKTNEEEVDMVDGACPEGSNPQEKDGEIECKVDDPWSLEEFFTTWTSGNAAQPDYNIVLADAFNEAAPNFVPTADDALSGASIPSDSFFTKVEFKGAVDPANDWTKGWTTSAQN